MTYADAIQRQELITGLRTLADFLESTPEVPGPLSAMVYVFPPHSSDIGTRREVNRIAKLIGAEIDDRTSDHGHYTASREFGSVCYCAVAIPERSRKYHDAQQSYTANVIPDADGEV